MTGALANLTQIINLSPQVGALAGGHLAALEAARLEAQVEVSQRLREVVTQTTLAMEEDRAAAAVEAEDRRRFRRRAPLSGAGRPPLRREDSRPPETAGPPEAAFGPFEPRPVVDVRV